MGEHVHANGLDIWTEQVGEGPDVLLIGGAGDTVESWQFQLDGLADRYRLDRLRQPRGGSHGDARRAGLDRGHGRRRGRCPPRARRPLGSRGGLLGRQHRLPGAGAAPPRAGAQPRAAEHLAGDGPLLPPWVRFVQWLVEDAPSERAFLEGFFLDIYTARAYNDGTVDQIIEEVLAFPHKQTAEDLQRYLEPLFDHDTTDRLPQITRPDARARRRPRPRRAPRARPPRRRADPRRPVRGDGRGVPSALPGDPGRVERPCRRLLARG